MTVQDLMDLLSKYPSTMTVMVDVKETGMPITGNWVSEILTGKSKGERILMLSTMED